MDKVTAAKIKVSTSMFIFGTIGIFVRYIPLPSSVIAMMRAFIGTGFLKWTMHILARTSHVLKCFKRPMWCIFIG